MNKTPRCSLKQCTSALILAIALGVLGVNITDYYQEYSRLRQKRQNGPYPFLGLQFSGLQDILQGTETIGYVTDKDLNVQQNAMQFAQAQFMLAPVVLDIDFTGHEYILLDCSRPEITWNLINKFRLLPLRRNPFGIVLARNPHSLKIPF